MYSTVPALFNLGRLLSILGANETVQGLPKFTDNTSENLCLRGRQAKLSSEVREPAIDVSLLQARTAQRQEHVPEAGQLIGS